MIKSQRDILLKKLAKNPEGDALRDFMEEKIKELSDISTAEDWENVLGRKLAIKKLKDILFDLKLLKKDIEDLRKNEYL